MIRKHNKGKQVIDTLSPGTESSHAAKWLGRRPGAWAATVTAHGIQSLQEDAHDRHFEKESASAGGIQFNSMFGSNMLLPRSPLSARIWGDNAGVSATVTVTLSDESAVVDTQETTADAHGNWEVNLDPHDAGTGFSLAVMDASSGETKTLTNVAIGDLYLCSGQSNMEFALHKDLEGLDAVENSDNSNIRMADIAKIQEEEPQTQASVRSSEVWRIAGPAAMFTGNGNGYGPSAVCYYFAKNLAAELQPLSVPIGIITSAWGGQMIEQFSSSSALSDTSCGGTGATYAAPSTAAKADPPSLIWNGMIHPLKGFRFAGTLWYQGEANSALPYAYACRLPSLITDWRHEFDLPEMMFLYVELAAHDASKDWVLMRQKMKEFSTTLPKVGYATAIDLGQREPAPYGTIHPQRKAEVGRRLALVAMHIQYGASSTGHGPTPDGVPIRNGNQVTITFQDGTASGLHEHGTGDCTSCCTIDSPFYSITNGTVLALPISAFSISGNTVVLSHTSLASADQVAYGHANYPECALYSGTGGPDDHTGVAAAPFVLDLLGGDGNSGEGTDTESADGWVLVFRQTAPFLWPSDQWSYNSADPENDNYAILDQLESFRNAEGKFTLKLMWPGDTDGGNSNDINIWKQTTNPVTATTGGVDGYEALSVDSTSRNWGGLEHNNKSGSLIDGSVNHWQWYYAVGSHKLWSEGYPGPGETVSKVELWAMQPWKLVFRQTYPNLWPESTWSLNAADPSQDNYADMLELEQYRGSDGKFTFKLLWPQNTTSLGSPQVWKQQTNPATATTRGVTGYEAVNVSYTQRQWGGIEHNPGSQALMDGSVDHWNWYYALGSHKFWNGGYPGPNAVVTQVELWVAWNCGAEGGLCAT